MSDPFPPHKCGLYLEHNAYKACYMGIEEGVAEVEPDEWISPEERQRSFETGDIWSLRWYPHTPVGFYTVVGSTLEAVLAAAKEFPNE